MVDRKKATERFPRLARADRALGRAYNRAIGLLCLLVGGGVALGTLASNQFGWSTHWPFLAFGALFLMLGRLSLRSRASLLEGLADTPVRPPSRRA